MRGGKVPVKDSALLYLRRWGVRLSALLGVLAMLGVGMPLAVWLMPQPTGFYRPPPGDTLVVLVVRQPTNSPIWILTGAAFMLLEFSRQAPFSG